MSEQKIYKPTPEELKMILENHRHWWDEDCEGWENMHANLSDANLSGAYLSGANLRGANLSDAYLSDADLSDADLSDANLRGAYLRGANLSDAYLMCANLRGANLRGANLRGADLSDADLSDANLSSAYLRGAYLSGAAGIAMACPSDGAFVGWKKALTKKDIAIVKLLIPEDAKRSSATGRKCRCDKAQVLAIYNAEGKELEEARSGRDKNFIYRPGEIVLPDSFDDDRWNECSYGIHFFITRQEAEDYDL